ncbi:hypothetical protein HJFPF1_03772 [Paramyrothecium foliicola]|nr:hypothetical protein HJFPF1_03772 [Paramyrothecium foliicola]
MAGEVSSVWGGEDRMLEPVFNLLVYGSHKSRHYSYECKASAQERPYVSRPSRSQQLRNPKLVPKLTNDTLEPLEEKKGVADQELAKREAERARKREVEKREDELVESDAKRRRSLSSDSVSTISTNASDVSRSPRRKPQSPPRQRIASRSFDSEEERHPRNEDRDLSHEPSPVRRRYRSPSRDSHSPPPDQRRVYRARDDDRVETRARDSGSVDSGHSLRAASPNHSPARRADYRARPPPQEGKYRDRGPQRGRRHDVEEGRRSAQRNDVDSRDRSLSPFSKRLALTRG